MRSAHTTPRLEISCGLRLAGGVLVKSNEQGAKGIGRNLIDKLNAHIVKIETGMRRR